MRARHIIARVRARYEIALDRLVVRLYAWARRRLTLLETPPPVAFSTYAVAHGRLDEDVVLGAEAFAEISGGTTRGRRASISKSYELKACAY